MQPLVTPPGNPSAPGIQVSPICKAVLRFQAGILGSGPFPRLATRETREGSASPAGERLPRAALGKRAGRSRQRSPRHPGREPAGVGERRSGGAEAGELGTARRARSRPGKWKKLGRQRQGHKTRTAHAGSLQERSGKKEQGRKARRPTDAWRCAGSRLRARKREEPFAVTCAASALAAPVPGEDARALLPLHLAREAQLGDDVQRLLAQAAHSVLLVETHRLASYSPVSGPFPFPLPLGWPLGLPKPSPARGEMGGRVRCSEAATLRSRKLSPWQEWRARGKAERLGREPARGGGGEVCANSPVVSASRGELEKETQHGVRRGGGGGGT